MKFTHRFVWSLAFLSVGCGNMPTPPLEISVPNLSSAEYEHLNCPSLKVKIDKLDRFVQELTSAQENRVHASNRHVLFYGWGRGDGMDTIELVKVRSERNAVWKVYDQKGCANM